MRWFTRCPTNGKWPNIFFGADSKRGYVIPHGLEEDALRELAQPQEEGDYLISIASIHPRKNTLLLAEAAVLAKTPIVFLGKPYAEDDPYFLRFQKLIDHRYVRYPGFVSPEEKYRWLRGARGFALLSQFESGCIAVFEAAGAGLPLLLSDLPWARKSYVEARDIHFAKIDRCGADRSRSCSLLPARPSPARRHFSNPQLA